MEDGFLGCTRRITHSGPSRANQYPARGARRLRAYSKRGEGKGLYRDVAIATVVLAVQLKQVQMTSREVEKLTLNQFRQICPFTLDAPVPVPVPFSTISISIYVYCKRCCCLLDIPIQINSISSCLISLVFRK